MAASIEIRVTVNGGGPDGIAYAAITCFDTRNSNFAEQCCTPRT